MTQLAEPSDPISEVSPGTWALLGRRLHDDDAIARRRVAVEVDVAVAVPPLPMIAAGVGGGEGGKAEQHQDGDSSPLSKPRPLPWLVDTPWAPSFQIGDAENVT